MLTNVSNAALQVVFVTGPDDDELLDAFYREVYLPEFRHQREPVEVWKARLADASAPYALSIAIAGAELRDPSRRRLDGGVVCELYPVSGCGFLTYLVVAPAARRAGLGRRLFGQARRALAEQAAARGVELALIFAEVSDPARQDGVAAAAAWRRLAQFGRWGAGVLDVPYVQPSLGEGLGRDRELLLLAFFEQALPEHVDGAHVAAFLRELYVATEGRADDHEVTAMLDAISARVIVRPCGAVSQAWDGR